MNQENKISDPDTSELRPETLGNLYRYTRDTKGTRTPKPELPELPEIKTPKGGTWGIKNSDQTTQENPISETRNELGEPILRNKKLQNPQEIQNFDQIQEENQNSDQMHQEEMEPKPNTPGNPNFDHINQEKEEPEPDTPGNPNLRPDTRREQDL
ncbi:hypothetical protein BKA70DRAFT_1219732 [Coprinopsis sp. MPI-PUGE-AT-0042]|nr:hypothetical protein BKA70DRAFT_1219732 [Coprinopsis sp. MPI-PUGE-AT-0042]